VLKLSEGETDGDNRPLFTNKITSAEVLYNPFEDIIPRNLKSEEEKKELVPKIKKKRKKCVIFIYIYVCVYVCFVVFLVNDTNESVSNTTHTHTHTHTHTRMRVYRNLSLLSFGAEDPVLEDNSSTNFKNKRKKSRMRSSHDMLDDPTLSKKTQNSTSTKTSKTTARVEAASTKPV